MIKQYFSLESWLNLLLYLGFLIIIFLMAVSLYITNESATSIKQVSQELHNQQINQTMTLLKLEQNITLSFSQLSAFLITGQEIDGEKFNTTLDKVIQGVQQSFKSNGQANMTVVELIELVERYEKSSKEVIELSGNREKNYLGIFKAAELLNPLYLQSVGIMEQLIDDELSMEDDINLELLSSLIKVQSSWYRMVMSLRVYFTTQGELDFQQFKLYREQNDKDIRILMELKDELDFEGVFIEELISVRSQYISHLPEVLILYRNEKWRYDIFRLKNEIYPLMSEIHSHIRKIVDGSESQTVEKTQFMQKEIDDQVNMSKWLFIISVTLGLSIVILVGKKISEIIQSLARSRREASENLAEAKQRAIELENTSSELRKSLNALTETQVQLIESEKMAALGGLVAGVAHEINTPVGIGITSSTYLHDTIVELENLYDDEEMTEQDFQKFIKNASESSSIITVNLKRAAELISSFKQIAVDQSSEEHRSFNLDFYLEEIILSLRPKLKTKAITIKKECPKSLVLNSFPGVISQIMTNLILNSITHGFEHQEQGNISIHVEEFKDKKNVDMIKIIYSDNGSGVSTEIKNKIFEPFYTTKRNKGGSGIGMSLVYNLVTQKLCGNLTLDSESGKGVCFTIIIPKHTAMQGVCVVPE